MCLLIEIWNYFEEFPLFRANNTSLYQYRIETQPNGEGLPLTHLSRDILRNSLYLPLLFLKDSKFPKLHRKIPDGLNKTYLKSILRQLVTYYTPDMLYTVHDLENIARLMAYNNLNVEQVSIRLTTTCEEAIIRSVFSFVDRFTPA
jgi:hypothetical protein